MGAGVVNAAMPALYRKDAVYMNKKILISVVIIVIILLIAGLVYMQKTTEPGIPVETPVPTEEPTPAPDPTPTAAPIPVEDPTATETPADTSGKYEVSPGVYDDGTVRTPSIEEWESMTEEEQNAWNEAYSKSLGGGDVTDISEEKTQEAFDILNDPNNPYIQEILEYKASLNN